MERQNLCRFKIICIPNRRKLDSSEIGRESGLSLSLSWRLLQRFVTYSGRVVLPCGGSIFQAGRQGRVNGYSNTYPHHIQRGARYRIEQTGRGVFLPYANPKCLKTWANSKSPSNIALTRLSSSSDFFLFFSIVSNSLILRRNAIRSSMSCSFVKFSSVLI
jgi:hypothetical protein